MRFEWDNKESINGCYKLSFMDEDNHMLCCLSLHDLRNKEIHSNRLQGVKFVLQCQCDNKTCYQEWKSDISLDDVKKECEDFVVDFWLTSLQKAMEKVSVLTPQVEWLKQYRKERDKN